MPKRLSEDHLLPSKVRRYKKASRFVERAHAALFNAADDIIDEVYVDICNGVSRSDIVQKLTRAVYESQKGKPKTPRTADEYYKTALDRMHFNTDIEHQRLKDVFYNRYESLLEEAIKKGDIFNARAILDSMAKIFLGTDKNNTNIQINSDKEGGVTVNFGFEKNAD